MAWVKCNRVAPLIIEQFRLNANGTTLQRAFLNLDCSNYNTLTLNNYITQGNVTCNISGVDFNDQSQNVATIDAGDPVNFTTDISNLKKLYFSISSITSSDSYLSNITLS